jgi:hypothetical protein
MASILTYGPSGFGKSSGIEHLDPKTTFVISSDEKELPWRGWASKYESFTTPEGKFDMTRSNYYEGNDPRKIIKLQKDIIEKRPDIKTIVYDTLTHMMVYRFMTDPNVDWDFYKVLAREIYAIIDAGKKDKSRMHIFIGHNEISYDAVGKKVDKVRTIGQLLDKHVDLPSQFTVVMCPDVIRKENSDPEYTFTTQSDGSNAAKSPRGMFDYRIPNNYKLVVDKYYEYQTGK